MPVDIEKDSNMGAVERKRGFKWWWPWESEKVEKYLEGMSQRGWRVVEVNGTCTAFAFERAEPENVRFCLDYQRQTSPEYKTLFLDAGWNLRYEYLTWYLWSKPYAQGEAKPEIYTDKESLRLRNRNLLLSLVVLLVLQVSLPGMLLGWIEKYGAPVIPVAVLYGLFLLTVLYGVARLAVGMYKLRRKPRI